MNWLTGLFTTARHEIRFRLQDREFRRAAIEHAAREFPTDQLERDLKEARGRLAAELERRFDAPMRANRVSLRAIRAAETALAAELAVLTRDHAGELKEAHAEFERLKSDVASAKRKVGDASDDLKRAKGRVSSWHNRSNSRIPFYGKRGKPIPRRSFFVFSHSHLDGAKRDADRAASRIGDAIRERDRVFALLKRCGDRVGELKESRSRRRALLDAGRTRSKVLAESAALQSEVVRLTGAEGRMQRLRDECVAAGGTAVEIGQLLESIREARARRASRLELFDGNDARESRRDAYRQGGCGGSATLKALGAPLKIFSNSCVRGVAMCPNHRLGACP